MHAQAGNCVAEHLRNCPHSAGCTNIHHLKLHCPALEKPIIPPLIPPPPLAKPTHPALSGMLKENLKEAAIQTAATKEAEAKVMKSDSMIPIVFR